MRGSPACQDSGLAWTCPCPSCCPERAGLTLQPNDQVITFPPQPGLRGPQSLPPLPTPMTLGVRGACQWELGVQTQVLEQWTLGVEWASGHFPVGLGPESRCASWPRAPHQTEVWEADRCPLRPVSTGGFTWPAPGSRSVARTPCRRDSASQSALPRPRRTGQAAPAQSPQGPPRRAQAAGYSPRRAQGGEEPATLSSGPPGHRLPQDPPPPQGSVTQPLSCCQG